MNADQLLLSQFDLLQRLRDHRFRDAVQRSMETTVQKTPIREEIGAVLTAGMEQHVRLSEAFRVTEDMCDLVIHASQGLDESDQISHTLAPAPWGFVRFEKGLPLHDIRDKVMLIHFMTWGQISHGGKVATFVTYWNDALTEPDDVWKEMVDHHKPVDLEWLRNLVGRWAFVGADVMDDGDKLGPATIILSAAEKERRESFWEEGGEEFDFDPGPVSSESFTNAHRYVHALWLLLGQTLVAVEPEAIKSSVRKRVGKMKIPAKVTVIMLRRRATGEHGGETNVEWQHRWLVRGHWAWRVCSDKHPAAQPAPVKGGIGTRVWINGYIKGPEDKPLLPQQHVYQFSR